MSPSAREALNHHKHVVRHYGIRKALWETTGRIVDEPPESVPPESEPDLSAAYPDRLAALEARMDGLERFFVRMVSRGQLWITIQEEDKVAENTLLHHFPDAEHRGGGHGLESFLLAGYDGSMPEGSVHEGAINEYRRLRYLHGARWVHVDPKSLFVWYGGREVSWWPLGESLRLDITLKEPCTLEEVQAAIVDQCTKARNEGDVL